MKALRNNGTFKSEPSLTPADGPDTVECPECHGEGTAMYSCCTGDVMDGDSDLCTVCKDHCWLDDCELCGGSGEVIPERKLK